MTSLRAEGPIRFAWGKVQRFSGILSSFIYSGANFLLVFLLQKDVTQLDFGVFALSQVFLQFGIGFSNALFAAPIVVYANDEDRWRAVYGSFARASLLYCLIFGIACAAFCAYLGASRSFAILFFILCFTSWMRWFVRSAELARRKYLAAAAVDMAYGVIVVVVAGICYAAGAMDIEAATVIQIVGCIVAFPVLREGSRLCLQTMFTSSFGPFMVSLREHGRWALLGVLTTEATMNAHAYLVGFVLGPSAFAPIAAITLFYRPINIVIQALTQYERPRMASALAGADKAELGRAVNAFRWMSVTVCVFNALLVAAILLFVPGIIGDGTYDRLDLELAAGLMAAINLTRALRGAESAVLQAGGHFRPLAMATLYTSPITLAATTFLILWMPVESAALSLVGVTIGETVMYYLYYRLYRSKIRNY